MVKIAMNKELFFFVGTEAELIKIFPIIIEAKNRGLNCKIIASGQNNITKSKILKKINCGTVDLELSYEKDIKKSAAGLLIWWINTYRSALKKIKDTFPDADFKNSQMIIHGDTVSTFMGAKLGYKLGMQVCHVEAGLRSHNFLNPFPEEIDRVLTSRKARLHFAPGEVPTLNLKHVKGKVINTKQNTLLDSLRYSRDIPVENTDIEKILNNEDYFVFVMHRQENLVSKDFVTGVISKIIKIAKKRKCVIILHEITKNVFIKFGLMESLKSNSNVILQPRVDYFDFMKLLENSAFVITDGGSNQEELFYMGKPCLIMRKRTERNEGIGINARLFDGTTDDISNFVNSIKENKIKIKTEQVKPSCIIVDTLMKN